MPNGLPAVPRRVAASPPASAPAATRPAGATAATEGASPEPLVTPPPVEAAPARTVHRRGGDGARPPRDADEPPVPERAAAEVAEAGEAVGLPIDHDGTSETKRRVALIVAVLAALGTIATGTHWAVVMGISAEWPQRDGFNPGNIGAAMSIRRYADRLHFRSRIREPHVPLTSLGSRVGCFGEMTELGKLESPADRVALSWACGDVAGVAAFLGAIGTAQIAALALCPIQALLTIVGAACIVSGMPRAPRWCAKLICASCAVVVPVLVITTSLLRDFTEDGAGPPRNAAPPSAVGWYVDPGPMLGFAGMVTVQSVVAVVALVIGADNTSAPPPRAELVADADRDAAARGPEAALGPDAEMGAVPVDAAVARGPMPTYGDVVVVVGAHVA